MLTFSKKSITIILLIIFTLSFYWIEKTRNIKIHIKIDKWQPAMRNCTDINTFIIQAQENDYFIQDSEYDFPDSSLFQLVDIENDSTITVRFRPSIRLDVNSKDLLVDTNIVTIGLSDVYFILPSQDYSISCYIRVDTSTTYYSLNKSGDYPRITQVTDQDSIYSQVLYQKSNINNEWTEIYDENKCRIKHGNLIIRATWADQGCVIGDDLGFNNGIKKIIPFDSGKVHGLIETWNYNGSRKNMGHVYNEKKQGVWTYWDRNGHIQSKGTYENSVKIGKWSFWHEKRYSGMYANDTAVLKEEGNYCDGLKDGDWKYWDRNSNQTAYGKFNKGSGKTWYMNNVLRSTVFYKDGLKDSVWFEWYPNKKRKSKLVYKKGILVSDPSYWSPFGLERSNNFYSYCDTVQEWYPNGNPKRKYLPMRTNAPFATWYENGNKKSSRTFRDTDKDSIAAEWYISGQKKNERKYFSSDSLYLVRAWHENGQLSVKGKERYMSNYERFRAKTKKNPKRGLWQYWDTEGNLIKEEFFDCEGLKKE